MRVSVIPTCCALLALLSACATTNVDLDPFFRDYAGFAPGASVIVVRDGRVIARRAYGMADLEARIAATPDTHYRLASVTKQFTAAAILTLAEERKLSIDDPIRRWLPALPAYADAITIRQLLTHTSGLVDYEDLIPPGRTEQISDAGVLRLLETQSSTVFPPGTQYRYSNGGYVLLGLIVEAASGRRFADLLHEAIFAPLGMNTTVAHEEGITTVVDRAYGYSREGTLWRRTDQSVTSATLGDGGIYTSVDELVNWIRALEAGRFAEASVPRVDTDVSGERYGFGWKISDRGGRRVVFHTGESIGFRNAIVRFPDEHLAVVVLTNRNEGHPLDMALAIAEATR